MKKILKIIASIMIVLLVIYVVIVLLPRPKNFSLENPMLATGEMPILIAHGGGNREFPDNTLEAFYNAYSVDERVMLETDVSITKDGVIILSHDTTLDRKTNVTGAIADWNYTDLMAQEVNFNYDNSVDDDDQLIGIRSLYKDYEGHVKYPTDVTYPDGVKPRHETVFLATTLEDLLVCFPENSINVEIKQSGDLGKKALYEVLRLLKEYDAFDRVVLASFHEEIYDEFQRLQEYKEVPEEFMYSPAYDAATEFFVMQLLKVDVFFDDEMCVFQLPMEQMGFDLATKGFVNTAHKHNLAVHYWTINETKDMRHLIAIGADGIMTDYPHRLKAVYESYIAE